MVVDLGIYGCRSNVENTLDDGLNRLLREGCHHPAAPSTHFEKSFVRHNSPGHR
jgi:hypothetical protein